MQKAALSRGRSARGFLHNRRPCRALSIPPPCAGGCCVGCWRRCCCWPPCRLRRSACSSTGRSRCKATPRTFRRTKRGTRRGAARRLGRDAPARRGPGVVPRALSGARPRSTATSCSRFYIERVCTNLEVHLNGERVHSGGRMTEPRDAQLLLPAARPLPAALLRSDSNVLDIKVVGTPLHRVSARQRAGGLSAVSFGTTPRWRSLHQQPACSGASRCRAWWAPRCSCSAC